MDKQYNIKVIGLDLDGTVFDDEKRISPRTLAAIEAAAKKGVAVMPATGRFLEGVPESFLSVPGVRYALTSNGSLITDITTGEPVIEQYLSRELVRQLVCILEQYPCTVSVYLGKGGFTSQTGYDHITTYAAPYIQEYMLTHIKPVPSLPDFVESAPACFAKISACFLNREERNRAWEEITARCACEIASSFSNNMEISAPGVDKGTALVALARKLGYDAENVMACGDSGNDLAMIRAAGLGVAMGNAPQLIKDAADYITDTNNNDGVAKAIEKFVL